MPPADGRGDSGPVPRVLGSGPSLGDRPAVREGRPSGYAEAYASAYAVAFAEAKAAAMVDRMRRAVLRQGVKEFGTPAAGVLIQLASVGDVGSLRGLAGRLLDVATREDMFRPDE